MKEIEIAKLQNFEYSVDYGHFSKIHRCFLGGIAYAYKSFDNGYMFYIILEKIKALGDLNISGSILPEYLAIDNNHKPITYLTRWVEHYTLGKYYVEFINNENKDIMIGIIKTLKNHIINLHNHGIIHGDIHTGNIWVNLETLMPSIGDFDNSSYNNFEINKKWCSREAASYINRYGVNKELDIFLFNLLTFEIIIKLEGLNVNEPFLEEFDRCFELNDDYKNICDTMVL